MSTDRRALILRYLDEQIALCEKATPGPWEVLGGSPGMVFTVGSPYGHGPMHVADARGWGHLTGRGACAMDDQAASAIHDANADLLARQRTGYPLALAALRAEALYHEPRTMHLSGDRALAACSCGSIDCPTISRIFTSLGLQEEA